MATASSQQGWKRAHLLGPRGECSTLVASGGGAGHQPHGCAGERVGGGARVSGYGVTSTAGPHGGNETTVVSLFIPMAHLGFIIVPTGYTHEKIVQGHGTRYGSSSVSGENSARPTADDLEVARHQGARVTQVAAALKAGQ
jgi:hypothetical protein